jgi:hypothetical protein
MEKNRRHIKIQNDLGELEPGREVVMTLQDVPLIENNRLVEDDTVLENEELTKAAKLRYLKGKDDDFEVREMRKAHGLVETDWFAEGRRFEDKKRGFYVDEEGKAVDEEADGWQESQREIVERKLANIGAKGESQRVGGLSRDRPGIGRSLPNKAEKRAFQPVEIDNPEYQKAFDLLKKMDQRSSKKKPDQAFVVDVEEELISKLKPKRGRVDFSVKMANETENTAWRESGHTKTTPDLVLGVPKVATKSDPNCVMQMTDVFVDSPMKVEEREEDPLVDFELLDKIESREVARPDEKKSDGSRPSKPTSPEDDPEISRQLAQLPTTVFEDSGPVDFAKSTGAFLEYMKQKNYVRAPEPQPNPGHLVSSEPQSNPSHPLPAPKKEYRIEYRSEAGRLLTPKEIYKRLSWKFHKTRPKIKKLTKLKNKEKKFKLQFTRGNNE